MNSFLVNPHGILLVFFLPKEINSVLCWNEYPTAVNINFITGIKILNPRC